MVRLTIRMLFPAALAVALWPRGAAATPDPAARASHEASEGWHTGSRDTSETAEVLSIVHNLNARQIEAANHAGARGASPEIKAFARRLAGEHARLEERVKRMAADAAIDLRAARAANAPREDGPSPLGRLAGLRGEMLDTAYVDAVVADYRAAIQELEEERREGQEASLDRMLAEVTPELRSRLAAAQEVRRSLRSR